MKQGYTAYKSANVDTADQGKLILIAYDVAIRNCKLALEKFGDASLTSERMKHLFKTQDAITELLAALRLDVGEVAHNLYRIYDYMLRAMVQASVKNDKTKVEEVLQYLTQLRGAWEVAIAKVRSDAAEASPAPHAGAEGWRR